MTQVSDEIEPLLEMQSREPHSAQAEPKPADGKLDAHLFIVVSVVMFLSGAVFLAGLAMHWSTYHEIIKQALSSNTTDNAAIFGYARALDAALVKTSALFLGFILVFTGALYVLRVATSSYQLSLKAGENSGALQTSSPGLVIITLGVVLVGITILSRTQFEYGSGDTSYPGQHQSSLTPAEATPTLGSTAPPKD